jgi:diaminopimelate decarboxylase
VTVDEALAVYQRANELPHVKVQGMDCHIGSQLTEIKPFIDALQRLLSLVDSLKEHGIIIRDLDLGGGLGVCYKDETPPSIAELISAIRSEVQGRDLQLVFEPGRSIAGNAGLLVTTVEYLKSTPDHNFAIVDAAMNDMIRPALYQAWLKISPVKQTPEREPAQWDIVGPVCETADFLGKDRTLAPAAGELLAVFGAGAYGFTMSSNYNTRGRAAEVVVDGQRSHLVRKRESIADIIAGESCLPD